MITVVKFHGHILHSAVRAYPTAIPMSANTPPVGGGLKARSPITVSTRGATQGGGCVRVLAVFGVHVEATPLPGHNQTGVSRSWAGGEASPDQVGFTHMT